MSEKLTLSELQSLIRDSLYLSLPQMYWVTAEISELTINSSGHCYLELIEKDQGETHIRARIRAIIWSSRFGFIRTFFENITGERLRSGIRILVRTKIEYHELYGLSLVINDIDPAFTLGEMALKRQQIINRLEAEGVISMNRELPFPVLPQKIAVVSSSNAAGYTDFIKQLDGNSFGYLFRTALFETPMQGADTEKGVVSALDRIAEQAALFDLVVIIRGGGSQTDLSWFDNYAIAYHITQFPLPVVTGIGHEKNLSVTDLVANQALKTPTAVAGFLIDRMAEAENTLNAFALGLKELTAEILTGNLRTLESFSIKLIPFARINLSAGREKLARSSAELIRASQGITLRAGMKTGNLLSRLELSSLATVTVAARKISMNADKLPGAAASGIEASRQKLERLSSSLNILDPVAVLKRGYTITSSRGKIIKKGTELAEGDLIDTRFSDSSVRSLVTGKKENKE